MEKYKGIINYALGILFGVLAFVDFTSHAIGIALINVALVVWCGYDVHKAST
jgi:hypothetical protein